MADTIHLYLKGKKTGDIKGESNQESHGRKDSIECVLYEHEVDVPRDHASGQTSGKRQHKPIKIWKRIDKASPLLANSCVTNEVLDGTFKFFRPNPKGDGTTEQFFTVKISNASISKVREFVENVLDNETRHYAPLEEVTFVFQKIEWTYTQGGIQATDDWKEGA